MVKVRNILGDELSGAAGEAAVFANWKGIGYRRKYVIPANPKTVAQTAIRTKFTNAVAKWHLWNTVRQLVFSFLASGQALSGFNLLVSRWQKSNPPTVPYPTDPKYGLIQISDEHTAVAAEAVPNVQRNNALAKKPAEVATMVYTKGTTLDVEAMIYCESGLVHFKNAQVGEITLDYTAAGKTITGEVLCTDPADESKYHVAWYPMDRASVVIKKAGATIQGMAISLIDGKYDFTKQAPGAADATIDYYALTNAGGVSKVLEGARFESTKANTAKVTFREYSDSDGHLMVGATSEDELYDLVVEYVGKTPVIEGGRTAIQIAADKAYIL